MTIEQLRERVEIPYRSAWNRGVSIYTRELLDSLEEAIDGGYFWPDDLAAPKVLEKALLNGAADWDQYSWEGCSLCYDCQIAERLCTPSELRKTRGGDRRPNSREEWLDVQARALFQAARRILTAAKDLSREETARHAAWCAQVDAEQDRKPDGGEVVPF